MPKMETLIKDNGKTTKSTGKEYIKESMGKFMRESLKTVRETAMENAFSLTGRTTTGNGKTTSLKDSVN